MCSIPFFGDQEMKVSNAPQGSYGWEPIERPLEEWRAIASVPGFEVSDTGRIRKAETKELAYILSRAWYKQSLIYRTAFPELVE